MKVTAVYFSPTGNTKKYAEAMAKVVDENFEVLDVTLPGSGTREFSGNELVIIGTPVYVGRVPALAMERLHGLKGNGTPCILMVTYGNRHYDDALAELEDLAKARGFVIKGAAALVARHTYGQIQTERPDGGDLEAASAFAEKAAESAGIQTVIPGNRPYKSEKAKGHFKPLTAETCVGCGLCRRNCPVGAIGGDFQVNPDVCISCFRCIRSCPVGAKNMNTPEYREFAEMFTKKLAARRENEFFL